MTNGGAQCGPYSAKEPYAHSLFSHLSLELCTETWHCNVAGARLNDCWDTASHLSCRYFSIRIFCHGMELTCTWQRSWCHFCKSATQLLHIHQYLVIMHMELILFVCLLVYLLTLSELVCTSIPPEPDRAHIIDLCSMVVKYYKNDVLHD